MFTTEKGITIPAVNEAQMREVDRIAVKGFNLGILQMMENAGRNLAMLALESINSGENILIFAGSGGNGGGGIACARHLYNRGVNISLILTKPIEQHQGAAGHQLSIFSNTAMNIYQPEDAEGLIDSANLLIDALIGYSLSGAPRGVILDYIHRINSSQMPIFSLDIPTGINSTDGSTPGEFIHADKTLTLALPKPGLSNPAAGELYLADIGIPPEVYEQIGIRFSPFFADQFILKLNVE